MPELLDIISAFGIIAVTIYILVKDVVVPLVQRSTGGRSGFKSHDRDALFSMNKKVTDLHGWHSPGDDGRQNWKNNPDVEKAIIEMGQNMKVMVSELRRINGGGVT